MRYNDKSGVIKSCFDAGLTAKEAAKKTGIYLGTVYKHYRNLGGGRAGKIRQERNTSEHGAVLMVKVNFCSNCGHKIPNAFVN